MFVVASALNRFNIFWSSSGHMYFCGRQQA